MKTLAVPVIFVFCFSLPAFTLDDVAYPRKSTSNSESLDYHVPSEYPTIQSALNAAIFSGGNNVSIIVEEGEYREAVIASDIKNLKLIGRKARILPPPDFIFTDPPVGENFPASSLKLIDCENFRVEGFTFIGDDFSENTGYSYPMGNAILSYNCSGTISNNIIFNYFDGISFHVDNLRWMKGEISENYIHNCLWSGILATGSHNLRIHENKIAFTVPKELSISVGIWTDGGIGIISENHITSYRRVDYHPQHKTLSGSDLWPAKFQFTDRMDYQVFDNTFEQSAAGTQFSHFEMAADKPYRFLRKTLRISNHFISVDQDNNTNDHSNIVMLRPE
jgi:hypothetical protein